MTDRSDRGEPTADERDRRSRDGGEDGGRESVRRNPQKDPDEWVTGDEPMTGPQESYLRTLAHEAGEDVDPNMTKADASKKIDELQERTGRGDDDAD